MAAALEQHGHVGRVLRIQPDIIPSTASQNYRAEMEAFLAAFRQHGFTIVVGGKFEHGRRELGITARTTSPAEISQLTREKAERVGLNLPRRMETVEDILTSEKPLVAKELGYDMGERKYLLKNRDAKVRFLTVALLKDPEALLAEPEEVRNAALKELMAKVSDGQFEDPRFKDEIDQFTVEEFIQTPSNRYTSFRIVVDARGKIRSELLLYSRNTKDHVVVRNPNGPFYGYDRFFRNSKMPTHIFATEFVSNISQGGDQINLVTKRTGREHITAQEEALLLAHGLDPKNPKLPQDIIEKVRVIGKLSRGEFPFVGVDFVLGEDGYYLLEINDYPGIELRDIIIGRRTGELELPEDQMVTTRTLVAHQVARRM